MIELKEYVKDGEFRINAVVTNSNRLPYGTVVRTMGGVTLRVTSDKRKYTVNHDFITRKGVSSVLLNSVARLEYEGNSADEIKEDVDAVIKDANRVEEVYGEKLAELNLKEGVLAKATEKTIEELNSPEVPGTYEEALDDIRLDINSDGGIRLYLEGTSIDQSLKLNNFETSDEWWLTASLGLRNFMLNVWNDSSTEFYAMIHPLSYLKGDICVNCDEEHAVKVRFLGHNTTDKK